MKPAMRFALNLGFCIALGFGCSTGDDGPSTAWTVIQALCTVGFLECVHRGVPGRGGKAAQYVLGEGVTIR